MGRAFQFMFSDKGPGGPRWKYMNEEGCALFYWPNSTPPFNPRIPKPMRILFVTEDFSGASLCARLAKEGHEVRAHVGNSDYARTLDGWVEKIATLEAGLDWVGKSGLVVCDDNGFGPLQEPIRKPHLLRLFTLA